MGAWLSTDPNKRRSGIALQANAWGNRTEKRLREASGLNLNGYLVVGTGSADSSLILEVTEDRTDNCMTAWASKVSDRGCQEL